MTSLFVLLYSLFVIYIKLLAFTALSNDEQRDLSLPGEY